MLITGVANSAVLFMAGLAFALVANYGFNFKEQKDRLAAALEDGMLPLLTAVLGIPGLIFLSSDGYYFGILPVLANLASLYGISMTAMGVAAMVPLATYYATPLIAWIFILCDRCEVEFADYQKSILKVEIPAFVLYIITFYITGAIPM